MRFNRQRDSKRCRVQSIRHRSSSMHRFRAADSESPSKDIPGISDITRGFSLRAILKHSLKSSRRHAPFALVWMVKREAFEVAWKQVDEL